MENVLGAEGEEQLADDLSQLSTWQGGSEGPSCSHDDPYAQASIVIRALPVDERETRRLVMKRKVLRHRPDGRVEVSDESPRNIEPDNDAESSSLVHSRTFLDDTISEGELETSSGCLEEYLHYDDDCWLLEDRPCSLLRDFGSDTISEHPIPGGSPTSYIVAQVDKMKRTDPAAKLREYKKDWERFSFPGEDSHQELRWAVRRRMLQPGPPPRPQRRMVPNKYVVPTLKKRESLRFNVRRDLARCLIPRRYTSS